MSIELKKSRALVIISIALLLSISGCSKNTSGTFSSDSAVKTDKNKADQFEDEDAKEDREEDEDDIDEFQEEDEDDTEPVDGEDGCFDEVFRQPTLPTTHGPKCPRDGEKLRLPDGSVVPDGQIVLLSPSGSKRFYTSFRPAVKDASDGFGIYVGKGTYNERIRIRRKKGISLYGGCAAKVPAISLSRTHRMLVDGFRVHPFKCKSRGITVRGGSKGNSDITISNANLLLADEFTVVVKELNLNLFNSSLLGSHNYG